jgi:hypothetical protein
MHRNLKFAFAAAVSAAFLMAAATVEATSITQNGGIIVSDTYEGDAVGADVVADVGAWVPTYFVASDSVGKVRNGASPGPAHAGSTQYAELFSWDNAGYGESLGSELNAVVAGDIVKFNSMMYLPSAGETRNWPWQFRIGSFNGASFADSILNFWRNADGTFTDAVGGDFAGPASLAHGVWQEWTVEKEFGTNTTTLTIDGVSVNFGSSAQVTLSAGSLPYRMGFFTNTSDGFNYLYLDDVVPEPATFGLLAAGGLLMLRRRRSA